MPQTGIRDELPCHHPLRQLYPHTGRTGILYSPMHARTTGMDSDYTDVEVDWDCPIHFKYSIH